MIIKVKDRYLNMDSISYITVNSLIEESLYAIYLYVLYIGDQNTKSKYRLDSSLSYSEAQDLLTKYQYQIDSQLEKENQCQQI